MEKIEYGNKIAIKGKMDIAKSLLEDDVDIVKIMKATGLTEEELLRLKEDCVTA